VTVDATDDQSDVESVEYSFNVADGAFSAWMAYSAPVTFHEDGVYTFKARAASAGGSSQAAPVSFKIDATDPTITATATPAPNLAGWNNTDVLVEFSCGDNLSGVVVCPESISVSTEEADQLVKAEVFDEAGNSASDSVTVSLDKTRPTTTIVGLPTEPLTLGDPAPELSCVSTDALSGVESEATLTVDDDGLNANGVGTVVVTCSGATDRAGNLAPDATGSYRIEYDFDGFFRPVEMEKFNRVKAGQAVPMKFSLGGDQGLEILEVGHPKSFPVNCDGSMMDEAVEVPTVTSGKSSLSYDADADQYNYVWKTEKNWAGTCRVFSLGLNDGSDPVMAYFNFTR
jgi:hypothetical protein